MENWGLVTYRSVLLLFDEKSTPVVYKQRIAYVVAHELVCLHVHVFVPRAYACVLCSVCRRGARVCGGVFLWKRYCLRLGIDDHRATYLVVGLKN